MEGTRKYHAQGGNPDQKDMHDIHSLVSGY